MFSCSLVTCGFSGFLVVLTCHCHQIYSLCFVGIEVYEVFYPAPWQIGNLFGFQSISVALFSGIDKIVLFSHNFSIFESISFRY